MGIFVTTPEKQIEKLKSTVTSAADSLRQKSENAVNIFKQTVANLTAVNEEIATQEQMLDSHISELSKIKAGLRTTSKENTKTINKIQEFLNS